jgi:hypothetical protein
MKLMIELTDLEFDQLWNRAAIYFLRENPRKAWTLNEKKEAVRYYIKSLISD